MILLFSKFFKPVWMLTTSLKKLGKKWNKKKKFQIKIIDHQKCIIQYFLYVHFQTLFGDLKPVAK